MLIQSRGALRAPDAAFRAAVLDVQRRVSQNPYVINLTSPYQPTHSGQTSTDERSALVLFQIRGDNDQAKDRVTGVLKYARTVLRSTGTFGFGLNVDPRSALSAGTELLT